MEKKIVYILNPLSGNGKNGILKGLIENSVSMKNVLYEIHFTEKAGHLPLIAREAIRNGASIIAVAGGDGTVHEAASALKDTNCSLAIIPTGSGNGFANHFHIPHSLEEALAVIAKGHSISIDTLIINGIICAATAGIGFDAHIAYLFSQYGKRGFSTYIKLVIKEYFAFKEREFELSGMDMSIKGKAFLLTFANTSQFGNNAFIAPSADAQDGLIDVCILKKPNLLSAPMLGIRLFGQTIESSSLYSSFKIKKIQIKLPAPAPFHVDGEPYSPASSFDIAVAPASLRLIIP